MPDCVKLLLLDALVTTAQTVTDIIEVHLNESTPRAREEYSYPVLFLHDEAESVESRNRVTVGTFELIAEIWAEGKNTERTLEDLRAKLKKALYSSVALRTLNAACRERRSERLTFADTDLAGAIVIRYEVIYLADRLDPFSQLGY